MILRRPLLSFLALLAIFTAHPAPAQNPHPLVVGYFLQGSVYTPTPYLVKDLIAPDGTLLVDQLDYSQGFVNGGHCTVADPNADLNYTFRADQTVDGHADDPSQPLRGYFHQLAELKHRFPKLKLLISLEGRGSDFAADAQPEARAAFVASCIDLFVKGNLAPGLSVGSLFDGIDVDWEYPHEPDAANFAALLGDLRHAMDAVRPNLMLTIAVGASPHMYEGTDMAAIAKVVDQIGLMTYDFSGPWMHRTGLIAPLRADDAFRGETVERSVTAYVAAGVPPSKLLMGLPFYGYGWRMVEDRQNGLFQEGQPIRGDRPYRDIAAMAQDSTDSTVFRDPLSQAPFLFDGDIFWTYDDPVSIAAKAQFGREKQLGGFMIWELAGDTPSSALLRTVRQATRPGESTASSLQRTTAEKRPPS